ncbi:5-oxoprolinase subunit C family protein [Vibrio methylphosphonaticus]|uniref:5-oxoprolinase subunit C family protein n=1 Tax=Vibrio methylphosphonaticus TaxID=2946866 RepID=UPI002029C0FC|nr:biotin-dependent carboxyltransferase family protein [Vibrio methylphosphonaticus]MCL9773210.1 biotin-dependent carboxyltransferase family protein [Vibrio methylphosphonaticus]
MPRLVVVHPGHLSLVQDLGRFGVAQYGLSQGGVADLKAHCWAQKSLQNPTTNSSIEILFGHAQFQALEPITMMLSGADCSASITSSSASVTQSKQVVSNWQPFTLHSGDTLQLHTPRTGARTYLSVQGEIQIDASLGSVSTVVRNRLGGIKNGEPLRQGDILTINEPKPHHSTCNASAASHLATPRSVRTCYPKKQRIRLIPSYQFARLDSKFIHELLSRWFTVSAQSDRMGIRLSSETPITTPVVKHAALNETGIISEGIACGSVQITHGGSPIILLQDRQTLGGYCKAGVIAFRDLAKLGQLRPGNQIQFERTNIEVEKVKQRAFYRYFSL